MRIQIALLLLAIMMVLWIDVGRSIAGEEFEPPSDNVVTMLMETLTSRGVKIVQGGLDRVEISERRIETPERNGMFGVIIGAPTFSALGRARLDLHTTGGDIIKLPEFAVRGSGDTREASVSDVASGIESVKSGFEARARTRGFLV